MLSSYPWRQGFIKTIPVSFGYIPLGIALGVLAVQMGYPWWLAPLLSVIMYSGAGQFLLLSLMAAHASASDIFIAIFLLSTRHIFYGLSLLSRFQDAGKRKPYLIFALTDETFSLITSSAKPDLNLDVCVTAFNHIWWVLGACIGVVIGSLLHFNSSGMEFALTALFIVLAVELYLGNKASSPLILGFFCALATLFILPAEHMLFGAILAASCVTFIDYKIQRK